MGIMAATRQIPSNSTVKKIRDFSSGILKQLAKVLMMLANMKNSPADQSGFDRRGLGDQLARAALALDLQTRARAERVRHNRQLLRQLAAAENLDAIGLAVGQADRAQRRLIDARAILKTVQRVEVDGDIRHGEAGVVEPALRDAAGQRHLAAFEADADRTARARGLALAAAAGGLAVAAGFTLAKTLSAMLGARTRRQG